MVIDDVVVEAFDVDADAANSLIEPELTGLSDIGVKIAV